MNVPWNVRDRSVVMKNKKGKKLTTSQCSKQEDTLVYFEMYSVKGDI